MRTTINGKNYNQRSSAYRIFAEARKNGMSRSDCCDDCGIECKTVGHHEDYSKPLEVRWLCQSCHRKCHPTTAENKRTERITALVEPETRTAFEKYAETDRRTQSDLAAIVIEDYIAARKEKESKRK